jgi:hypothetical protein
MNNNYSINVSNEALVLKLDSLQATLGLPAWNDSIYETHKLYDLGMSSNIYLCKGG